MKNGEGVQLLTRREEEILRAIHYYRYVTALDIAVLLFSPRSITHVREILARLAGGADCQPNQYLYRFPFFDAEAGNAIRVYTLGSRGRQFLSEVVGLPVDWYFRPDKVRHLSYNQVLHNLVLTRVLVRAKRWGEGREDFGLADCRTCYEIVRGEGVTQGDPEAYRTLRLAVPDAWLKFERLRNGQHDRFYPVLLEIDRGREYRQRFQEHVRGRIDFIRSGTYKRVFNIDSVRIAYLTIAHNAPHRETRLTSMCEWTMEVLKAGVGERWADVFRFAGLAPDTIYSVPMFEQAVWRQPGSAEPITLFPP